MLLQRFLTAVGILSWLNLGLSTQVTFDGRSFLIDGKRNLFVSGSIHYPRAPRNEWSAILQQAKDNGINLIQTYVFWDVHEPRNNEWNFPSDPTSSDDLVAFVQEAANLGLLVHLRIAGYICAEWNFGGMPGWLRDLNTTLRSHNSVWERELSEFVEKTLSVVKDANLLASQGGPIVMLQMENEYGNMENYYGDDGHKYVQWLSDYALSLDVGGVPWVMCQQGEGIGTAPSAAIVNACNGFYCDNWISKHAADFPDQPHMWTENWPGWFQNWGEPVPHRPAVDVAFAVARWYARGGSYMNYYMAFGGSTFGRSVGGPLIVTSYDYDVQINEYAMRAEPKFSLLQLLHSLLHAHADTLLAQTVSAVPLNKNCESHTYVSGDDCIAFLSNWGEKHACSFPVSGLNSNVEVPAWSVTIMTGSNCTTEAYNTKTSAATVAKPNAQVASTVQDFKLSAVAVQSESVPSSVMSSSVTRTAVVSEWPQEQLSLTKDATDYLWYSTALPTDGYTVDTNVTLKFNSGTAGGGLFYFYINGVRVASSLGTAGGPPVTGAEVLQRGEVAQAGEVDMTQLTETLPVKVVVPVPKGSGAGSSARLDILSVSMGLKNYGPFLENIQVGIASNITADGRVLQGFTHTVGLTGETAVPSAAARDGSMQVKSESCDELCWYSASFATPASVSATSHLALQLSPAMGKGAVWVNGHMLGRYWNVTAALTSSMSGCHGCDNSYSGSYNGDKCRTGCGAPSQTYYKLPTDWLVNINDKDGGVNSLVLFEELKGARPQDIALVEIRME